MESVKYLQQAADFLLIVAENIYTAGNRNDLFSLEQLIPAVQRLFTQLAQADGLFSCQLNILRSAYFVIMNPLPCQFKLFLLLLLLLILLLPRSNETKQEERKTKYNEKVKRNEYLVM
jgi:hypothetical protein